MIAAPADPAESIDGAFTQERYRTVKERCYYSHRFLYCRRISKTHLAKEPERLCLYLYRFMIEKRRNIRDLLFPPASVFRQRSKIFIQIRFIQQVTYHDVFIIVFQNRPESGTIIHTHCIIRFLY